MIKFELERYKKNISDEELVADLKHVASELKTDSLTQEEYNKHGHFHPRSITRRFGSWLDALAKAALKRRRTKSRVKDAELIADLKRVSFELKNESVTKDEYDQHGKFHSTTLADRFGSWIKAKEKAGLKRREHPSRSDAEYFRNLEEVWIKLGRQPHFSDMRKPLSECSGSGYMHKFGTWRKALERFIEYVDKEETPDVATNLSIIHILESSQKVKDEQKTKAEEINNTVEIPTIIDKPTTHQKPTNGHKTKRYVSDRLRFKIMKRDNFKCQQCGWSPATGTGGRELQVDHKIPWSKGGETTFENLRTLCSKCNIGKGNLE